MATTELVIALDARMDGLEASLKRVTTKLGDLETNLRKVQQTANDTSNAITNSFSALTRGALAVIGFQSFRAFAAKIRDATLAVDDLNASIRRLSVLTNTSMSSATGQFNRLLEVAARTGQPVTDLTNQFTRFYTATASLGASQQQVEQFVNTLAQFARISGQSPQEAAAAITQLAQGLASGKLQGDELRSIMENMPQLASALARELGVSVGQLRQMGSEGRLTAENVFPAILRAGQGIQRQLEGMPLSLRQSWQAMQDAGVAAIAAIDRQIGASEFLSYLFQQLAAGGRAVAVRFDTTSSQGQVEQLNRQLQTTREELTRIQETRRGLTTGERAPLPESWGGRPTDIRNLERRERELLSREQGLLNRLRDVQQDADEQAEAEAARRRLEGQRDQAAAGERAIRDAREHNDERLKLQREFNDRVRALDTAFAAQRAVASRDEGAAGVARVEQQQREVMAGLRRQLAEDIAKIDRRDGADGRRAEAEARRQERERIERARERQRLIDEIAGGDVASVRRFEELVNRIFTADPGSNFGSAVQVFIQEVQQGTQEVGTLFGFVERQASSAGETMARSGQDMTEFWASLERQLNRVRDALVEALGPDRLGEIEASMQGVRDRVGRSLDRIKEKATKTWDDIGVAAVNSFADTAAGAIVDFVSDAEKSFEELAANFLKQVAKMILQFIILQSLVTGFRALGWNPVGLQSVPGLPGLMAGGPAVAGQAYIVGERQPELFVPGSSGYVFPSLDAMGGGMNVIINQNVPNAVVDTQQIDEQTVLLSVNLARQQTAEDYRRSVTTGYGTYAEVMSSRYAIRRRM